MADFLSPKPFVTVRLPLVTIISGACIARVRNFLKTPVPLITDQQQPAHGHLKAGREALENSSLRAAANKSMSRVSQFFLYVSLAALMAFAGIILTGGIDSRASEGHAAAEENSRVFNRYSKIALLSVKAPDEKLLMPVRGITRRQIADTFGAARAEGRSHGGQDIFAKRGTPVFSATEGVVLRVGENNLGGKVVFVYGAGGRRYYYAHLDDFAPELKAGDAVTTGTLLGFVGTTGNARNTPPHLHFGVYEAGGAINPLPLLTDRNFNGNN